MTRLPEPYGTRIDRSQPVIFRFEGRSFTGFAGDTIASALAAQGQWMLSRSFKFHRPRGVFSMAGAEANTLVQVGGEPNVAADLTGLAEGMDITAQNVTGSLERDRNAVLDRLGRFLPVGFYYRTFIGPRRDSWQTLWEPLIRSKAGLGMVDLRARPGRYEKGYLTCDVLVVGGGAAGLAAALALAAGGVDTILCEAEPELGGVHCWAPEQGMEELIACSSREPNLRILTGATCNGWFEDNWLPLIQGRMLWRTRASCVVLATGGIQQPAVFRNNDLPGVMTVGAAQRLMRLYAVRPGRQAVVSAGTPEGLRVASDLQAAGVSVGALVVPRPLVGHERAIEALQADGVAIWTGDIAEARGKRHLEAVRVGERWLKCDLLAVSIGHMPAWQLPCQAGGKLSFDAIAGRPAIAMERDDVMLAGIVNGVVGHAAVLADGRRAAARVLSRLGRPTAPEPVVADPDAPLALYLSPLPSSAAGGKDFVDFDEDLQVKDLRVAVQEGYREIELLKRFTTVGMGPSQGRHSALNAARVMADATGRTLSEVGVTVARPPVGPETLGVLAGPAHQPERRTALHHRHGAGGAEMRPVGAWWRPFVYGQGDRRCRIVAEVRAVRDCVGVLDVSTLGKLEVRGRDAGEFLDRLYTMAHGSQPVGRVRYGLMLNELGAVVDDGVVWRLAKDVFYVTATTGAVARVFADMAFWNAQWRLAVDVVNLTSAFAALNVTGPLARSVVENLGGDIDFSRASFGYLEGRLGTLAGIPVRVMRIGFTGELSFELHCPQRYAVALWDAVLAAGKPSGLVPYGLEASRILRLEKGHILIGQDTDALSSPDELGLNWALSRKKPFYVGKRSVEMRLALHPTRRLVGVTFEREVDLPSESCLVLRDKKPVGHVTSVAMSPTLGHGIALAFVHPDDAAPRSPIVIRARSGRLVEGRVSAPAFFDPDNLRQAI